jgi:hypothetical protein
MDPDEALIVIRKLLPGALDGDSSLAFKALEQFEELDSWLSRGGLLPKAWSEASRG